MTIKGSLIRRVNPIWIPIAVILVLVPAVLVALPADDLKSPQSESRFRGPVALALVDDGKLLLTANRRSGTVSVIDLESNQVRAEFQVGKKLSALVAIPGGNLLLATDEETHELALLTRNDQKLHVVTRLAVPHYPVSVAVSPDGHRCYIASLWSRRLSVIEIQPVTAGTGGLKLVQAIPLPFAPRRMLLFDEGQRLIVADGFGGQLAAIDTARGVVESVRELPAHNIRGLSLNADGSRLLVSHQILNALARTTPDDVHWGMLMGNVVRALKLDHVRDPKADLLRESVVHPVGEAGNAAADPAEVEPATYGRVVVALSGVGEIGVFPEDDSEFHRIAVGGRPTALALTAGCSRAYAADELGDCVSVIDLKTASKLATISLGPRPELTLADRGERLFYDGRLSHQGWMSCHSCHTDGHSNGLLNDNLGDGAFGAPKRVLSLGGVAQTGPWAWNGQMTNLEQQTRKSVETTMRGKGLRDEQAQALVAFLQTLGPVPPGEIDETAVDRGRLVFEAQNCKRCHAPPFFTSPAAYDVGLKDELDAAQFNPPSLRGVGQRDALFHDNRARSLTEVFSRFRHQLREELPERDVADLVAFLRSL